MFDQHKDCTNDSTCHCDQPKKAFDCLCGKPIMMKPRHIWRLRNDDEILCTDCENGE